MPGRSPLDALLTYVGCFLAAFVPTSAVATVLLPPDGLTNAVQIGVTAVLAVPLAVWYWRAALSLGNLGEFVFTTAAVTLLVGVPTMLVLGLLDATPTTGSLASDVLGLAFVGVVNVLAYLHVYRGGLGSLRGSSA